MNFVMPLILLLGILAIALEDKIRINKSATAVLMCISLWLILLINANSFIHTATNPEFQEYIHINHLKDLSLNNQITDYLMKGSFIAALGNVSETLFFVMCSMLIVNIVDRHGGFVSIANYMRTEDKRKLLWYICFASFFFSALLDNLAAAIVLIAILHKLVPDSTDRMKYACMIVISANAGGSWSPIGDVTTLLLWTGGNLTAMHQIWKVILPAFANMIVPLIVAHFWLFHKSSHLRIEPPAFIRPDDSYADKIPFHSRVTIFILGILSLAMVPVFQVTTHLPAFFCVLLGLVFLWIYTDFMYHHLDEIEEHDKLSISRLFQTVDLPTIFFFLGILMSVAALETGGQLTLFANFISSKIHQPLLISFLIGLASSFTDNVALVSATMGMYPIAETATAMKAGVQAFATDGQFWTFLAYCAVTGGSILIIGSATGVTVMGIEKISFTYYLKRFTPLAILGYTSGALVFLLIN